MTKLAGGPCGGENIKRQLLSCLSETAFTRRSHRATWKARGLDRISPEQSYEEDEEALQAKGVCISIDYPALRTADYSLAAWEAGPRAPTGSQLPRRVVRPMCSQRLCVPATTVRAPPARRGPATCGRHSQAGRRGGDGGAETSQAGSNGRSGLPEEREP